MSEVCEPAPVNDFQAKPTAATQEHSSAAGSESANMVASGVVNSSPQALATWKQAAASIDGMLSDFAGLAVAVETAGSQSWKIIFPSGAHTTSQYCEQGDRKAALQAALKATAGREIILSFGVMPGEAPKPVAKVPQSSVRAQKMREMAEHPYVKKVCELLEGEIVRVDPPRNSPPKANGSTANSAKA